jgi:hypothetical protein
MQGSKFSRLKQENKVEKRAVDLDRTDDKSAM